MIGFMESHNGEVCNPNISPKERRKRLVSGLAALGFSLILLVILLLTQASVWWRLALMPFFFAAGSGYFQWRDKT